MVWLAGICRSIYHGRWWGLGLIFVLVTWFWLPALSGERIIIHGDSAHHGLSLVTQLSRALHGDASLLWDSRIYGGHPLLAESQGAFLNPLNALVAYLFEPVWGGNILHWLAMLVGAYGVYCLARLLDIRPWLATFAALGVAFSTSAVLLQSNYTVSSTLMWMPWVLVALEYWLKSTTIQRALPLALAVALMVVSGYPQLTHGVVLYAAVSLLAMLLQREGREQLRYAWGKMLISGLLAVLLAIGLAMAQLLPLLELAGESHRGSGIGLLWPYTAEHVLRGAIYFYSGSDRSAANVGNVGSAALLLLAVVALLMRMPHRILGHFFGAFLLFNLGLQQGSPLFIFLYEHHLIPGLHFYRSMHLFFPVAVIGIGILAAFSLERVMRAVESTECIFWLNSKLAIALLVSAWAYTIYLLVERYVGVATIAALVLLLVLAVGILLSAWRRLPVWLPLMLVLSISADIALNRMMFSFYPRSILDEPATLAAIKKVPGWQDFKVMRMKGEGTHVLMSPASPNLPGAFRRYLVSLAPMPAAGLGIASLDGELALQLARREILTEHLANELEAKSSRNLGWRLVDILSIKYVSTGSPLSGDGFKPFFTDSQAGVVIQENLTAKPRFQFYQGANAVEGAQTALAALIASSQDTLFIESHDAVGNSACSVAPDFQYAVKKDTPTAYVVDVQSACAGWLFFADANYPGWKAWVNDQPVDVYSAQVLGKAISIPAGKAVVRFEFVSRSFQTGAIISAVSLLVVALLAIAGLLRERRQ